MTDSQSRSRSRSPARKEKRKPRLERGLRWKEKPKTDEAQDEGDRDDLRREKREKRRNDKPKALAEECDEEPRAAPTEPSPSEDLNIAAKFGAAAAAKVKPIPKAPSTASTGQSVEVKKPTASKSKAPTGPMMLVAVNDRLGTKKEVPCLGADTIGDFKKLVAMQIGRKPHEIMLKRQSERALKDHLTLDDYEISSGVQLDLELNTGD